MLSNSGFGGGGSSLRVNGSAGDSMVMGHSRRGSPLCDRVKLSDRSMSSTSSTVIGGNMQKRNGYTPNGKVVNGAHLSMGSTNGRRIPTPPYITSISSREQHDNMDGEDDHDDHGHGHDEHHADVGEPITMADFVRPEYR